MRELASDLAGTRAQRAAAAAGPAELWIRWVRLTDDPRPTFYYQRLGDATATGAVLLLLAAVVVALVRGQLLAVMPVAAAWLLFLALQQHGGGQPRGAQAFAGLAALCLVVAVAALALRHYTPSRTAGTAKAGRLADG